MKDSSNVAKLLITGVFRDGKLDVAGGNKVGASCSLCHTITDGSVLSLPGGGSIGKRIDGPANHDINLGSIFAAAPHPFYFPDAKARADMIAFLRSLDTR